MRRGPAAKATEPPESIPTDTTIIIALAATRPGARPRRLPVRLYLLSYKTAAGRTESQVYRQLPAALRHADRLTSQGLAATVSVGTVGAWSTTTHLPAIASEDKR